MPRRRATAARMLALGAAAAVLAGCSDPSPAPSSTPHGRALSKATAAPLRSVRWTEQLLLGQLLMVADTYGDLPAAAAVVRAGAGGLVLIDQAAAGSGGQLSAGIAALQRTATVPVLV